MTLAGSSSVEPARGWRACLVALTDALARAEREELVLLDLPARRVRIDSTLDDVDERTPRGSALPVSRPDGLWEWEVRRDFVRGIRKLAREDARRLADTLGGMRTKRRFEVALGLVRDRSLVRAFALFRRRRLRGWAARVLRAALAGYVTPSLTAAPGQAGRTPPKKAKKKSTRRRGTPRKRRSRYVPYVS